MSEPDPYAPPAGEVREVPTVPDLGLRLEIVVLVALSALILAFPLYPEALAKQTNHTEAWAAVSLAWSVWLLARNYVLGWIVGLLGVVLYAIVFWNYELYGEVGLQGFYFVTSVQAIVIWLRGTADQAQRPVDRVTPRTLVWTALAVVLATVALGTLLHFARGAVAGWDALTTVLSVTAHLYLMGRYVESWYLWVAVDTIYVPLYASRGLTLTAGLYLVFWILALRGLLRFRRLYAERLAVEATP